MEEEEEKLHYPTLNYKMEIKLLLNSVYLQLWNPKGVFIGTRGTGARDKPWPEARRGMAAKMRHFAVFSRPKQKPRIQQTAKSQSRYLLTSTKGKYPPSF